MRYFITRVELHDQQDYQALHLAMEQQRFHRIIPANDGRRYHLPTGVYYSFGNLRAADVRLLANTAAAAVATSWMVFVCDFSEWAASGLVLVL